MDYFSQHKILRFLRLVFATFFEILWLVDHLTPIVFIQFNIARVFRLRFCRVLKIVILPEANDLSKFLVFKSFFLHFN